MSEELKERAKAHQQANTSLSNKAWLGVFLPPSLLLEKEDNGEEEKEECTSWYQMRQTGRDGTRRDETGRDNINSSLAETTTQQKASLEHSTCGSHTIYSVNHCYESAHTPPLPLGNSEVTWYLLWQAHCSRSVPVASATTLPFWSHQPRSGDWAKVMLSAWSRKCSCLVCSQCSVLFLLAPSRMLECAQTILSSVSYKQQTVKDVSRTTSILRRTNLKTYSKTELFVACENSRPSSLHSLLPSGVRRTAVFVG